MGGLDVYPLWDVCLPIWIVILNKKAVLPRRNCAKALKIHVFDNLTVV